MTITQQPAPPLPPGADPDNVDSWQTDNGVTSRLVWSTPMQLPDTLAPHHDIRVVASQLPNGSIITDDPQSEGPFVYLEGTDYRPDNARTLAQALLTAANIADEWAGHQVTDNRLAMAKAAVLEAYTALRTAPGNAGDYLRAALDCIADAQETKR